MTGILNIGLSSKYHGANCSIVMISLLMANV